MPIRGVSENRFPGPGNGHPVSSPTGVSGSVCPCAHAQKGIFLPNLFVSILKISIFVCETRRKESLNLIFYTY